MNEDVQFCLEEVKEQMQNVLQHLEKEFQKIRAGKSSPQMLDGVKVDYYGTITPLNLMANINTPDSRSIVVQPWDKNMLGLIEKAILSANLGFNPKNDGTILRIIVPPLTEERRKDLVKKAKVESENSKISIRNIRREANDTAENFEKKSIPKDEIKKLKDDIQNATNLYIAKIDKIFVAKETDIMTV